jgi:hypothetical protein
VSRSLNRSRTSPERSSLERSDAGNGTRLPADKLGNTASKPANRDAGNLTRTQNPRPTANRNADVKKVRPADRLGNSGPKPANRDAAKY